MKDKEQPISRQELKELIREVVAEEIAKRLALYQGHEIKLPGRYVSEKELCEELNINRSTVNNWRKKEKSGQIMAAYMLKTGGRNMFNIEGIKRAIQENPDAFSGGREYPYQYEQDVSEEMRDKRLYSRIKLKMQFGKPLTREEQVFFEAETEKMKNKWW